MKLMSSFAVAGGLLAALGIYFFSNTLNLTGKKTMNNHAAGEGPIVVTVAGYKHLPDHLYGFNTQFSRISEPWSKPEFIKLAEEAKPSTMRYPGGTVSSFWDVENGRLFADKSNGDSGWVDYSKFPNSFITKMVDKDFVKGNSIEDLSILVKKTGIVPVFCLNMCTPGEDYYEYKWKTISNIQPGAANMDNNWWKMIDDRLNRNIAMLKKAQSLGIPIKYIELGNEYYASNIYFVQAFPDGVTYAKAANYFAGKLKQLFPEAEFAALGTKDARINRKSDRSLEWNKQVISTLDHSLVHAITIHAYEATDRSAYSSEKDVMDGISSWRSNIGNSFRQTSVTNQIFDKGFEIWYTEFEAKYSMDFNDIRTPGQQNLVWANSLISAYVALYLQFNGNTGKIMYHKFDDLINDQGDYKTKGTSLIPIFKAAHGMQEAGELTFTDKNGIVLKDLVGSAYKKDNMVKCAIINISPNPVTIDVKSIFNSAFKIESYNNSNLMNDNTITVKNENSTSSTAILPAYSVSLIEP